MTADRGGKGRGEPTSESQAGARGREKTRVGADIGNQREEGDARTYSPRGGQREEVEGGADVGERMGKREGIGIQLGIARKESPA